jgi:hypothetical protein
MARGTGEKGDLYLDFRLYERGRRIRRDGGNPRYPCRWSTAGRPTIDRNVGGAVKETYETRQIDSDDFAEE